MSAPVGLCSRKRAEYLMMSAAVAGGAIYVHLDLGLPGFNTLVDPCGPIVYLCVGRLPDGEAVPTRLLDSAAVLAALREEVARLTDIAKRTGTSCLDEMIDDVEFVLRDLEGKLEVSS